MFKKRNGICGKNRKTKKKNPDKFYAFTSDFNKLNKILTNAKDKIKKIISKL